DMMSAVALTTVIWQGTRMVMPALGGIIIAVADTWLLFAFCSVGFFIMFLVLLTIKIHSVVVKTQHSTLSQIKEGLRFILHSPEFLILITLSYAICFFATSYMQLMPAFADMLSANEQEFGYMLSIGGIGAVVGTIFSSSLQNSRRLGTVLLYSAIVYCGFIFLFAAICLTDWHSTYLAALAMIFLSGIFNSIFMITSTGVLQLEVPDELRGRVMGLHAITYNMLPLGALFTGAIASFSNPSFALVVSTCIVLSYLLWIALKRPDIRGIDGTTLGQG
ncbi:MAG: MFS transporter, partial [Pseudomonadales bacterium]|nr:MFS transporter [Pseudomonadales bacterium]